MSTERTERPDFQATSDPALRERETPLLDYRALYALWERQQWAVQDLDFTQDRIDWHERIPPDERYQRMYGLSAFFCGEQRVAAELGPIMRAVPDEDMRIFLCTQIADEARHVMFFDRFYSEVGVLEADTLAGRLAETSEHLNPEFGGAVRRAAARARRPAGARARGHGDARRGDHDLPHGRRGDAGADRPALHHRLQREGRDAAGLRRRASRWWRATSTATSRSAPASCATWCAATSATRAAIQRALVAVAPAADGVLRPKWFEGSDDEATLLGVSVAETRAFALTALERRLKAIGLGVAAA